jgi:hypothetical protein
MQTKEIKIKEVYINEEVKDFYIDEEWYYCVTEKGRCLNITKSVSIHPPVKDIYDYFSYLWIETLEGFFLFKQEIVDLKPKKWILEKQIIPDEEYEFFYKHLKKLKEEFGIEEENFSDAKKS